MRGADCGISSLLGLPMPIVSKIGRHISVDVQLRCFGYSATPELRSTLIFPSKLAFWLFGPSLQLRVCEHNRSVEFKINGSRVRMATEKPLMHNPMCTKGCKCMYVRTYVVLYEVW